MICLIKFLLFGPLAGLFQLINLWVIYTAFATMHFCSVLIYLIMCSFDLLFVSMDWQRLMKITNNDANPFVIFLFVLMVIYYILAIFYSYRSYNHFKMLFFIQIGSDAYQQHGYDDNEA
jgi:hypothetical protein